MPEREFKYDVAISFLAPDEQLALDLASVLKDRLSVFVYPEQQKELAGTDGEAMFNEVFGRQSRVVVVLHRDGWGSTPWTRIEETAIRNPSFIVPNDDGAVFAVGGGGDPGSGPADPAAPRSLVQDPPSIPSGGVWTR